MEVIIENEQEKIELTKELSDLIIKAIKTSLSYDSFDIPSEISVMIVDDERIREINKEHREIDKSTDVLSFPMVEMAEGKILSDEGDFDLDEDLLILGDIIISLETALRQSDEYGHSFEREVAFLATHGVFHLLGYDHIEPEDEEKMLRKQEEVLIKMGLSRNEK